MKTITVNKLLPQIYEFCFSNDWELELAMFRIYHFPQRLPKKKHTKDFGYEQIISKDMKRFGDFEYFGKWGAFALSKKEISKFFMFFKKDLSPLEFKIKAEIDEIDQKETKNYFVLITPRERRSLRLNHEIAHALFSLDKTYKKQCLKLVSKFKHKQRLFERLLYLGYHQDLLEDESQAYLSTSTIPELKKLLQIRNPKRTSEVFRNVFKEAKKRWSYRDDCCKNL